MYGADENQYAPAEQWQEARIIEFRYACQDVPCSATMAYCLSFEVYGEYVNVLLIL